jgi:hypothetical protein
MKHYMRHESSSSTEEHVYYPVTKEIFVPLALLILVALGVLCLVYDLAISHTYLFEGSMQLDVLFLVVLLYILLLLILLTRYQQKRFKMLRLVISPQGIHFYGPGYTIYTPWDKVVGLGPMKQTQVPNGGFWTGSSVEGLLFDPPTVYMSLERGRELHQPVIEETQGRRTGFYRFARIKMIPIGYFQRNWEQSPLVGDLRRYAPQLFQPAPH